MPKFTPAQQEVINETGKNITVAASAGSGKTTVLVARIMKRVLDDGVPVDRILAMTFTEAAAAEMKKRLAKALNDELGKGKYPDSLINEQLIKLQNAWISTIDSFCLKLIKENYAQIGFDIERCSNILDEADSAVLEQEAMEMTLKAYEADEVFEDLRSYLSTRAYDNTSITSLLKSVANIFNDYDYEDVVSKAKAIYSVNKFVELPEDAYNLLINYIHLKAMNFLATQEVMLKELPLVPELNTLVEKKEKSNAEKLAKAHVALETRIAMYQNIVSSFEPYKTLVDKIHQVACVELPAYTADDFYSNNRKEVHASELALINNLYDEKTIINDLHNDADMILKLLEAAHDYLENFKNLKVKNKVMDFVDMEHYAMEILKTSEDARNHYKDLFIDIMVDEFQDSARMQDDMLAFISKGNNIFRVGDVKQSIYGFRGAVPEILKGYIDAPGANDSVKILKDNFRSKAQIINYVNAVFEILMNQKGLTSNFNNDDVANVGSDAQIVEDAGVEFRTLIYSKDELIANDLDAKKAELKANYIARLINEDKHNHKDSKWSDYCVLLRTHGNKKVLKDAFEALNIPYFMDAKDGFYKSSVIQTITSFLHFLTEPKVDIYFLAVAMSPLYELKDEDITKIYLQKERYTSYYEYAQTCDDERLKKLLEDASNVKRLPSLKDKLLYIYNINNLYEVRSTKQERSNLDMLLEKAVAFDTKYPNALHKFLATIEAGDDDRASESLSHNNEEDVVNVMTIHHSKGLQYSKVIYWGKERSGTNQNASPYAFDAKTSLFMPHIDLDTRIRRSSLFQKAIEANRKAKGVEEEIRLIYVAFTRAVDRLFLVDVKKDDEFEKLLLEPLTINALTSSEKYLDYIYQLSKNHCADLLSFPTDKIEAATINQVHSKPMVTHEVLDDVEHENLKLKASDHGASLREWSDSDTSATNIGTLIHAILEHVDIRRSYRMEELKEIATSIDASLADTIRYEAIENYLAHPYTRTLATYKVTHEMPFITITNNQLTQGYMDMVAENDEEFVIIDYKSDVNVSREELKERYTNQLTIYANSMAKAITKPIKAYLYSLSLHDYIEIL